MTTFIPKAMFTNTDHFRLVATYQKTLKEAKLTQNNEICL